jgi:mannose-6-phosphate isomerase-like protein (cupin superfamily)
MKIVKKSDSQTHKNSDSCVATEYPMDNEKDINIAYITINGRYPEKGKARNNVCKEVFYIVKGSGTLYFGGEEYEVGKGDVLMVEPGDEYYWEGNVELVVPCSPAWYPEQYEVVGD